MQQVFGENVKVQLPKSYHSADASKGKVLAFMGVSSNITLDDFIELVDFVKINHVEAERMKSKRSGRDLPFIKIKCDTLKQAEALIFEGLVCQKTGIIFKDNTLENNSVLSAKVLGTRHQIVPKTEMCCVC